MRNKLDQLMKDRGEDTIHGLLRESDYDQLEEVEAQAVALAQEARVKRTRLITERHEYYRSKLEKATDCRWYVEEDGFTARTGVYGKYPFRAYIEPRGGKYRASIYRSMAVPQKKKDKHFDLIGIGKHEDPIEAFKIARMELTSSIFQMQNHLKRIAEEVGETYFKDKSEGE